MRGGARSTSITPASWSRGTGRRRWPSPTAARSAPRSTATASGPRATSSRATISSSCPSESGVLPVPGEDRSKVAPAAGQDAAHRPREGRIVSDEELKAELAASHYDQWLKRTQIMVSDLPLPKGRAAKRSNVALLDLQQAFGYTQESLKYLMSPMATTGQGRSARWAPTRRSRRCRPSRSCCTPISSRTSRR